MAGPAFPDPLAASRGPGADRVAALYSYAPSRGKSCRHFLGAGTIAAALLWLIGSAGFSFYVARFSSYDKTYGSIGAVVILLIWFYVTVVHHPGRRRAEFRNREGAGTPLSAARSRQFSPRLTAVAVIAGIAVIAASARSCDPGRRTTRSRARRDCRSAARSYWRSRRRSCRHRARRSGANRRPSSDIRRQAGRRTCGRPSRSADTSRRHLRQGRACRQ